MTAKEFVLSKIPNAKAEKQKTTGFRAKIYWLIRIGRDTMWFSEGTTEAKAWKEAKERILEQEDSDD